VSITHPWQVERWGVFEISLEGPDDGDSFHDTELSAVFENGSESVAVHGFYDGAGRYAIRFSPGTEGPWTFETRSDRPEPGLPRRTRRDRGHGDGHPGDR
jgi:hypothetical protein